MRDIIQSRFDFYVQQEKGNSVTDSGFEAASRDNEDSAQQQTAPCYFLIRDEGYCESDISFSLLSRTAVL